LEWVTEPDEFLPRCRPTEQFYKMQVRSGFLDDDSTSFGASIQFVFGRLSQRSNAIIKHGLEQVLREFSDLHREDMKLPREERHGSSILLAIRSWDLRNFGNLRREDHAGDFNE
jgi:hypothetical protein